jgi:hypothetical protein
MARPLMRWLINLNPLDCHDEGDGIGDAEPYLWTSFFAMAHPWWSRAPH